MRRALTPTASDNRACHDRYATLVATRVAPLRSQIDQLVHGQEHEVVARVHHQGPFADRRGADSDAGERIFTIRNIEDAARTKAFVCATGRPKDALEIVNADTSDEDVGIVFHTLDRGFVD